MSLLSPPSLAEARQYVRHNGVRRSLTKFLAGYIAGRQRWHVTLEDLRRYAEGISAAGRGALRQSRNRLFASTRAKSMNARAAGARRLPRG